MTKDCRPKTIDYRPSTMSHCLLSMVYCLWSAVLFSGCGYTTKSTLPSTMKTIHVESFKNSINFAAEGRRNIYLPLLETKTRNALINRFLFDGNLKIAEADKADLILKGELKNYDRTALRYTDNDDIQEYRVHITVSLECWDTHKQEVFWSEPAFVGEATYFLTGTLAGTEESAVEDAVEDLARRIVERTIENW